MKELGQRKLVKRSYEANITTIIEKIKADQKRFGASLAKIFGVLRKKEKQGE